MKTKQVEGTVDVTYMIYFINGDTDSVTVTVSATANRTLEHNYGADADGNRGIDIFEYDDITIDEEEAERDVWEYIAEQRKTSDVIQISKDSIDESSFSDSNG